MNNTKVHLRQRFIAALLRRYPLYSGCARVANHRLMQRLTGTSHAEVWAPCDGGFVRCNLGDFNGRMAYYVKGIDPKITWVVKQHLRPGDVAIDAGANLGMVSLVMARCVGPQGRIHSFEPNPQVADRVAQTLARNELDFVTLHRFALGREDKTLTLHIPENHAGGASLVRQIPGESQHVDVPVRTLDSIAADLNLSRLDFIKLDVEGFELDVLQGAADTIKRLRPRGILFELNTHRPDDPQWQIFKHLATLGYRFHAIPRCLMRMRLDPFDPADPNARERYHDYLATLP